MERVALVHDKFVKMGEPERVLDSFCRVMPDAEIFSAFSVAKEMLPRLERAEMHSSWMRRLPALERFYRQYFLFYPFAIESLDLSDYDLIISNCLGFAKGVHKRPGALHINYCHSPMLWAWQFEEYAKQQNLGWIEKRVLRRFLNGIIRWDRRASQRPDYIIASSRSVARQVQEYYGRVSIVIPPPVDVNRFALSQETGDHYLVLGDLVPENRIEMVIKAFESFQRRLIVIGDGPESDRLHNIAGDNVKFFGKQAESITSQYVSQARAVIFTGRLEYGRPLIEVNGAGRPVLAWREGIASELVLDGNTGVLFDRPNPQSIQRAVLDFESIPWDRTRIRTYAEQFDLQAFMSRIRYFMRTTVPSNVRTGTKRLRIKAA